MCLERPSGSLQAAPARYGYGNIYKEQVRIWYRMRPRISETAEERIEELDCGPHENKSRFVEYAVQRYIDDLESRGARE